MRRWGTQFVDADLTGADFTVARDVDRHNFESLPAGTPIGWLAPHVERPLVALDDPRWDLQLTFNPGWVGLGETIDEFTDIRDLSRDLSAKGLEPGDDTTGATPSGPASFTLTDPDGNAILFDQHV